MNCIYCNNEMRLDDIDFNFKGNQDNYYICDCCHTTAYEKIRHGKSVGVEYCNEEET